MSKESLRRKAENYDDAEEVEMLEIPELDEREPAIFTDDDDKELDPYPLETGCPVCDSFIRIQADSSAPQLILDLNLKIRWRNLAYRQFRETPGLSYNYRERTFDDFFSTFVGASIESNIQRTSLFSALDDIECGKTWQGIVEGVGPNLKYFRATLIIKPLVIDGEGTVRYFEATLQNITESYQEILQASYEGILKASLLKDEDTGNHIKRVNNYSRLIAEALLQEKTRGDVRWIDVDDDFVENIGNLAAFHDVGKIGTPDSVLLKAGKLDDDEWIVMKEHAINGALILSSHPKAMAGEIARSHHERWDGTGYPSSSDSRFPEALDGDQIPLSGRIVALADVYDALRTRRPYKEPFSEEKTASIIIEGSGSHFDPGIIDVFRNLRDEFDRVFRELGDG